MGDYIDKLAFIYLRDGKLLVTLSHGKDTWYIPGGKREAGESDEQALMREVEEELNVQLKPETITKYGVFEAQAHGKPEGTMVRMTCYTADFDGEPVASSEIEKLDFFGYDRMLETSVVDHLIMEALHVKGLLS
jgi:8-oxo-dGTP diphosphatase